MYTRKNFEMGFQKLKFKISIEIKITSVLYVTTSYTVMAVLSVYRASYDRKQVKDKDCIWDPIKI